MLHKVKRAANMTANIATIVFVLPVAVPCYLLMRGLRDWEHFGDVNLMSEARDLLAEELQELLA